MSLRLHYVDWQLSGGGNSRGVNSFTNRNWPEITKIGHSLAAWLVAGETHEKDMNGVCGLKMSSNRTYIHTRNWKMDFEVFEWTSKIKRNQFDPQCLKITQNALFEFLNFGIFRQFLCYLMWPVWYHCLTEKFRFSQTHQNGSFLACEINFCPLKIQC